MAVKGDGKVSAVGLNKDGQCNVGWWTDIRQVAVGSWHTVGLKKDGTVVATGNNDAGQCDVEDWKNVKQIVAEGDTTVALMEDGTVAATRYNMSGESWESTREWRDIESIAMSLTGGVIIGAKKDGTIEMIGQADDPRMEARDWKDIDKVYGGFSNVAGIKRNGIPEAAGYNSFGECNVIGWTDISSLSVGGYWTIGVKEDGTVVRTRDEERDRHNIDLSNWDHVVYAVQTDNIVIGLQENGTLLIAGEQNDDIDNDAIWLAQDWKDICGWTL
ncbi:MAG: hypothetical protein VB081_12715 [Christensenella sp.]|uniref:hypothetical protein n=1 Tax=Christensenella sp. TaxID=1935934 RepID=UPI002B20700F|nr:hypothetical protein [Christensenella sp.]MEA5004340.1 hypothetical protein [Christensenella sp.]